MACDPCVSSWAHRFSMSTRDPVSFCRFGFSVGTWRTLTLWIHATKRNKYTTNMYFRFEIWNWMFVLPEVCRDSRAILLSSTHHGHHPMRTNSRLPNRMDNSERWHRRWNVRACHCWRWCTTLPAFVCHSDKSMELRSRWLRHSYATTVPYDVIVLRISAQLYRICWGQHWSVCCHRSWRWLLALWPKHIEDRRYRINYVGINGGWEILPSINSSDVRKSSSLAFARWPQLRLSMVIAFSHLCNCNTPGLYRSEQV